VKIQRRVFVIPCGSDYDLSMISTDSVTATYLIRHGAISDVLPGHWSGETALERGAQVIVRTARGEELGQLLQSYRPSPGSADPAEALAPILRRATDDDRARYERLQTQARSAYVDWVQRIADWNLDLQLIDLEWTLDETRLILYVLNERGPECTKLALQAVAAGFGIIDVQPVSANGLVTTPSTGGKEGGCGSCGCHS